MGKAHEFVLLLDKPVVIAKIILFKNITVKKMMSISSFIAAFKLLRELSYDSVNRCRKYKYCHGCP